jgi:hypothetical protein
VIRVTKMLNLHEPGPHEPGSEAPQGMRGSFFGCFELEMGCLCGAKLAGQPLLVPPQLDGQFAGPKNVVVELALSLRRAAAVGRKLANR